MDLPRPTWRRTLPGLLSSRRWPISAAVAVFFAVTVRTGVPDLDDFAHAGRDLLSGHLSRVYSGEWNQAGPLQLVVSALLGSSTSLGPVLLIRILVNLAIIAAARALTQRFGAGELAANATAVMTTLWLGPSGFWSGHPAETMLVPALWVGAAIAARDGRWVRAGLLLGVAAAVAPWAVLGAPALLVGGVVNTVRAGAVGAAVTAAFYLPFVASGRFAMFDHVWPVSPFTLVHLVDPSASSFDWRMRLVQAVIVAGGCAAAALALREHREAVVFAPLLAALLRIATDPLSFDYYWLPVGALALIALCYTRAVSRRHVLVLVAIAYLPWLALTLSGSAPGVPTCLAVVGVLAIAVYTIIARRTRTSVSAPAQTLAVA